MYLGNTASIIADVTEHIPGPVASLATKLIREHSRDWDRVMKAQNFYNSKFPSGFTRVPVYAYLNLDASLEDRHTGTYESTPGGNKHSKESSIKKAEQSFGHIPKSTLDFVRYRQHKRKTLFGGVFYDRYSVFIDTKTASPDLYFANLMNGYWENPTDYIEYLAAWRGAGVNLSRFWYRGFPDKDMYGYPKSGALHYKYQLPAFDDHMQFYELAVHRFREIVMTKALQFAYSAMDIAKTGDLPQSIAFYEAMLNNIGNMERIVNTEHTITVNVQGRGNHKFKSSIPILKDNSVKLGQSLNIQMPFYCPVNFHDGTVLSPYDALKKEIKMAKMIALAQKDKVAKRIAQTSDPERQQMSESEKDPYQNPNLLPFFDDDGDLKFRNIAATLNKVPDILDPPEGEDESKYYLQAPEIEKQFLRNIQVGPVQVSKQDLYDIGAEKPEDGSIVPWVVAGVGAAIIGSQLL